MLEKEKELKQRLFRHKSALQAATDSIERDRQIVVGIQKNIDGIYERIRGDPGHMTAEDVKTLREEESRRRRWEMLNKDKMQGYYRLIDLMNRLEQELLDISTMSKKSKKGKDTKPYIEIPREQRLTIEAPACAVGKAAGRSLPAR
jgi:hypothetical protein